MWNANLPPPMECNLPCALWRTCRKFMTTCCSTVPTWALTIPAPCGLLFEKVKIWRHPQNLILYRIALSSEEDHQDTATGNMLWKLYEVWTSSFFWDMLADKQNVGRYTDTRQTNTHIILHVSLWEKVKMWNSELSFSCDNRQGLIFDVKMCREVKHVFKNFMLVHCTQNTQFHH